MTSGLPPITTPNSGPTTTGGKERVALAILSWITDVQAVPEDRLGLGTEMREVLQRARRLVFDLSAPEGALRSAKAVRAAAEADLLIQAAYLRVASARPEAEGPAVAVERARSLMLIGRLADALAGTRAPSGGRWNHRLDGYLAERPVLPEIPPLDDPCLFPTGATR